MKIGNMIPLIKNLKIYGIFKNKNKEKRGNITDLISVVLWLLRRNIDKLIIITRNTIKLVEL